ncbi:MAG: nitroreductase family protein [Gammaproteobacteria bacterium]
MDTGIMIEKSARTEVPIAALLSRRWSGRAFDSERPVAAADLLALMEAARWAPSCFGDEPWRFVVCERERDGSAWAGVWDCLAPGNQGWAKEAPLLIAVTAASRFQRDGRPNRWGSYDTGAAAMSLALQATELGLMVHQMGGFDEARLKLRLGIPEDYHCMSVMAVGYALPAARVPETLREREQAPRSRRPWRESFYFGAWGRSRDTNQPAVRGESPS